MSKKEPDTKDKIATQTKKFRDEFKDFIAKGNAMDLAIGMVLGAAFTSIVTSIVNDILMPLIGLLVGGVDFTKLEIEIPNYLGLSDSAHIRYGNFLQAVVNFFIIALALFIILKNIEKMKERAEKALKKKSNEEKKESAEKEATEKKSDEEIIALLTEIRDSLKKKK
ncbi:MAG: large conductance mechanosensitive channel protein MscL [Candidatus Saccharibacteria bacterium]|nr:large conductance mechanosensitive channel protein MscL [Candidatus Saccharibacteria bacterium]